MSYGSQKYKQTAVTTASRGQVLILLYEAAIRNIHKASDAITKGQTSIKGESIGKAHEIINELLNSLDYEAGGTIAKELERLYVFIIDSLFKANIGNDTAALQSAENVLKTLLDGWRGAVKEVEGSKGPESG